MKSANTYSESSDGSERSVDKEEILVFPAKYLLDLPLNTSLFLRVPGFYEQIIWTTRVLERPRQPSEQIWFDKEEVRALITGSESERAWPNDLREWCWMKRESSDFVLDLEIAQSGAQPIADRNWDVGRVLDWFELELVSVAVSDNVEREDGSVDKAA